MIAFRIAGYAITFVFWFLVAEYFGVTGQFRAWLFVWTILAGAAFGYYVVDHGLRIRSVPGFWRIALAVLVCFLIPLYFCLAKDKAGSVASRSSAEGGKFGQAQPTQRPVLTDGFVTMDPIDAMKEHKTSFDDGSTYGRKTAFDPPRKFGRSTADIRPVLIGTNKWRICFETPGPAMIMTGLSFKQGDTYYIKMDREAESIQFGWLGEDIQGRTMFSPLAVPASVLVDSVPFKYTKSSPGNNTQLAFNVATIPNGRYEIEITKSQFLLRPGEYAPGTPSRNRW